MRIAHLLRKCDPAEWGGTESAMLRLLEGLRRRDVESIVYCPRLRRRLAPEPLEKSGCSVKRFRSFLPILGISKENKRQLLAVGGNLMSLDLPFALARERKLSIIHTHTMGRIGGIGLTVARWRRLPLVLTIHGGFLDLPPAVRNQFLEAAAGGWEWGKICGWAVRAREVVSRANAIITCNPKEAALLAKQYPGKRIVAQPHGVPFALYRADHRTAAREAFPAIQNRVTLLCVGRIDPVKNQAWLVRQSAEVFRRHPAMILVFAGACTDEKYRQSLRREIEQLGLQDQIILTGGFDPADPRLIGLFQEARAVVVPSISETFGLVILEAWAAGRPVVASRTSGALALVRDGGNGWLFDLDDPAGFHRAIDQIIGEPARAESCAAAGSTLAEKEYDSVALAGRVHTLYQELIDGKQTPRHT